MEYTTITTEEQYEEYCNTLVDLLRENKKSNRDKIEMLDLLTAKWEKEHYPTPERNPVELLQVLMRTKNLSQIQLAEKLDVGQSHINQILNYKRGFSKELIRKIAETFKVTQEAFNRPYPLKNI
ncbi:MAG: helix-turn-helix transcriptional regulator [Cytophagaceae bacterium]